MSRFKAFAGRNEREWRKDRYSRRPNANLNSINGQRHLEYDERVFTRIITYTEVLNH